MVGAGRTDRLLSLSQVDGLGWGWGALLSPRGGPHPLLSIDFEVQDRAPSGRGGCSTGRGTGWARGTWGGQACRFPPTRPKLPQMPQQGGWGLPLPRPQVSAANMSVLVSFILIFGCFLHSLSFLKHPYSQDLREESQGQLTKGSWSQD